MRGTPSIIHEAIVSRVDMSDGSVDVVVNDHEGDECSSCAAAALCRRKGGNVLTVRVKRPELYKPGMSVRIGACSSMHHRAVLLMLGLPCLLLVCVAVGLILAGFGEGLSAAGGISGAVMTYVVLYVCRHRLGREFEFEMLDNE